MTKIKTNGNGKGSLSTIHIKGVNLYMTNHRHSDCSVGHGVCCAISKCKTLTWQTLITMQNLILECPPPKPVPNGRLLGNLNTEFSKRRLVCDPGYVSAANQRQIVCKGGVWSPTPSCNPFGMFCLSCFAVLMVPFWLNLSIHTFILFTSSTRMC